MEDEIIPEEFVAGEMLMIYKKKSKDDRANYRSLSLLNHGYEVFATILLRRITAKIVTHEASPSVVVHFREIFHLQSSSLSHLTNY